MLWQSAQPPGVQPLLCSSDQEGGNSAEQAVSSRASFLSLSEMARAYDLLWL